MEYDTKQCATLEDMHGEITEEEYFERLAHRDALECSASCYKNVFGYHTGNCLRRGADDIQLEKMDQTSIDMALGK